MEGEGEREVENEERCRRACERREKKDRGAEGVHRQEGKKREREETEGRGEKTVTVRVINSLYENEIFHCM